MKREQVKERYKWKIEDIYPSDEEWEKDFENLQSRLDFRRMRESWAIRKRF